MKARLILCGKFAFAVLLLWVLYHLQLIKMSSVLLMIRNPWLLAGLIVLAWFTFPLCTLRWRGLLKKQGIESSLSDLFKIVYSSSFLGLYLPGVVGGDIVRTVFGSRLSRGKIPNIALSVLFDRFMGVLGLLVFGLAACIIFFQKFWTSAPLRLFMVLMVSFFVIGILLTIIAALFAFRLHELSKKKKWQERTVFLRFAAQVIEAIIIYSKNSRWVFAALVISILVHGKNIIILLIISKLVFVETAEIVTIAIAGVIAFLTNFIPLTPGGIGIGETAFSQISLLITSSSIRSDFGSIFLIYRGLTILALLPAVFATPKFIKK